jgi:membrane protein YdbS with pleckstrin-like domain
VEQVKNSGEKNPGMRTPERRLEYLWLTLLFSVLVVAELVAIAISNVFQISGPLRPDYIIAVLGILAVFYAHRKYLAWGFEMREDHLYLKHGVFKKVETMVPFVRIQHVDTQRNVLERIFGISRVVVYTAGSRGSDVTVKGLLPEDAVEMQEKLRDVAIESEDRDAV